MSWSAWPNGCSNDPGQKHSGLGQDQLEGLWNDAKQQYLNEFRDELQREPYPGDAFQRHIDQITSGESAIDAKTYLHRVLNQLRQNRDHTGSARLEHAETEFLIRALERFEEGIPITRALGLERPKRGRHPLPATDRVAVKALLGFLEGQGYAKSETPNGPTAFEVAADILSMFAGVQWKPETLRTEFGTQTRLHRAKRSVGN